MQIDLTPDPSLLVIIAIFVANYFVVRKWFLRPINQILTDREGEIRGAEKRYEESLAKFNLAVAEMEEKLHHAKREGSEVRERERSEALEQRQQVIRKTRAEAEAIVATADEELRAEVGRAKEMVVREADELARMAAERILGRKLA
ncbi:MAG TPA: ATP synthase F0 subunit B [Thermoanaerobaculia bacterium]|nr:ATP synthase F0 subunit B [Thermoanaerobaculia bacterium]